MVSEGGISPANRRSLDQDALTPLDSTDTSICPSRMPPLAASLSRHACQAAPLVSRHRAERTYTSQSLPLRRYSFPGNSNCTRSPFFLSPKPSRPAWNRALSAIRRSDASITAQLGASSLRAIGEKATRHAAKILIESLKRPSLSGGKPAHQSRDGLPTRSRAAPRRKRMPSRFRVPVA